MRLTVLLLTYKRTEYAEIALRSTLDNLKFDGEIGVHIADDGSPKKHVDTLRKIAGGYSHIVSVGLSNSERGGYGRNYNLATQQIHASSDLVLCLEDDWRLTRELDINPLAKTLLQPDWSALHIGCVRLGYLGFTDSLRGALHRYNGETFLRLNEQSPEKHVWAGHPRLETVDWQRVMGPWPEGLSPGDTELAVCSFARQGIAWPLDLVAPNGDLFVHIGTKRSTDD